MADNQSKERMTAEAAFAKTQGRAGGRAAEPTASPADQNTARLKAARLERDASNEHLKAKGYLK
ncbi:MULTISPECIES: hypothetical protein [Methylobacterium]|uniref:hypothetical protein n=1 Tax=Methylobacterium TaxID=407 RepID=UPI0011CBEEDE|nr:MULTISPECIES: hypothetical protein [Methylobacterium]TXN21775.1 hypothetical protein FV217_13275 [Methylobacterium sp. WL9]